LSETGTSILETPVGPLAITLLDGQISALRWEWGPLRPAFGPVSAEAARQLAAYFDGRLTSFDLPLLPAASPFAASIRQALCAIPYGQTLRYGDIARDLGVPAQAVGQGCGANPIAIIVPCHRVLAANGLGGFSGGTGIEAKVALLRLEGAASLLL